LLLVVVCLLCLLTVPLARGSLLRLADVELHARWTVLAAIVIQVLVITVFPAQAGSLGEPVHLATYALAAAFLWRNQSLPGLWIIGLGAAMNLSAITANGGVMPATPGALDAAGMVHDKGSAFANSAAVDDPRLAFLGDVFAVPASWPLSNVFSVGDVAIVLGVLIALHAICGSRIVPARVRPASRVRLLLDACSCVVVRDRVLVRVAGSWSAKWDRVIGPVSLVVGGNVRLPLPDPGVARIEAVAGASPPAWRAAFALSRDEFEEFGSALELVAVDEGVRAPLPPPARLVTAPG
jgi:hypothetical protein